MEKKQEHVNAMALAIGQAETRAERALIDAGRLAGAMKDFREGCDLHVKVTSAAQEAAAAAVNMIAEGLGHLSAAHDELEKVCRDHGLPAPQSGGGGK